MVPDKIVCRQTNQIRRCSTYRPVLWQRFNPERQRITVRMYCSQRDRRGCVGWQTRMAVSGSWSASVSLPSTPGGRDGQDSILIDREVVIVGQRRVVWRAQ